MKSKATKIIANRDRLSTTITKYWNIIYIENVVNKNYKRNYDLKELFSQIRNMAKERANTKLKALCLNMGFKRFSDLPKDCIQSSIFMLSELQEIKVKLGKIRTLDPKMKAAKGKKNLNKTEILTSDWVKARIKEIDLQIIELKKKIEEFNENTELEEDAPMEIVAKAA